MKRFISGFLSGALIAGTIGAFAASYIATPVDFKVLVNGEEFVSDPPALEVEGRTYLPLRAIGDALGVPVTWNEELYQAEVGQAKAENKEEIKDETQTYRTKITDAVYSENPNICNFGVLMKAEPYKVETLDSKIGYTYRIDENFINYQDDGIGLNPLAAYEYILKNNGFTVSTDRKTELTAYTNLFDFNTWVTAYY